MTEGMEMDDWNNAPWETRNGRLIKTLVSRVFDDYDELPEEYVKFLSNLGKNTSVSGYLQVTSPNTLQILEVCYILYQMLFPSTEGKNF